MAGSDTTYPVDLRGWAAHSYPDEAAVEMLERAFGGRFARPGNPWIVHDDDSGRWWVDFEAIADNIGWLSSGEQKFLLLVASIGGTWQQVRLGEAVCGVDRGLLALVLAGLAHAGGSHEHSGVVVDAVSGRRTFARLDSLHPWPDAAGDH